MVLARGAVTSQSVLRVTGVQVEATRFRLTWPGKAGKTPKVLGGDVATGPYQAVQTNTATTDGSLSVALPVTGNAMFFLVEEAP